MRRTPSRWRPITAITTPAISTAPISRPRTSKRKPVRKAPSALADAPSRTNTAEKPATKPALPRRMRERSARTSSGSRRSSTETPETSERYAGSSGTTHGDSTEIRPAPNAATSVPSEIPSAAMAAKDGDPRGTAPAGGTRPTARAGRLEAAVLRAAPVVLRRRCGRHGAADELERLLSADVRRLDDVVAVHRGVEDRARHLDVAGGQRVAEPGRDAAEQRVHQLHRSVDQVAERARRAHPHRLRIDRVRRDRRQGEEAGERECRERGDESARTKTRMHVVPLVCGSPSGLAAPIGPDSPFYFGDWQGDAQNAPAVSSNSVTGPAFTSATSIRARKRPVTTGRPAARSAFTSASTRGSARSGGAASTKDGRRPRRTSPSRVNCDTTPSVPPTSRSERFIRPASSSKTRRCASFSASAVAS